MRVVPEVPISGRVAAADEPQSLARMATRAEGRSPDTLERVLSAAGAGGELTGSLRAWVAAAVVGVVLVQRLIDAGSRSADLLDVDADEGAVDP